MPNVWSPSEADTLEAVEHDNNSTAAESQSSCEQGASGKDAEISIPYIPKPTNRPKTTDSSASSSSAKSERESECAEEAAQDDSIGWSQVLQPIAEAKKSLRALYAMRSDDPGLSDDDVPKAASGSEELNE